MAAGAVGDEIERVRGGGVQDGGERRPSGVGDRPRRQAAMAVGVVGVVDGEVAPRQGPPQRRLPRRQRVDHRRVRLQPHAFPQPVQEHRGDHRPLGGDARLLLHDRGQHQGLVRRVESDRRIAVAPERVQRARHVVPHAGDEPGPPGAQGIMVGLGQERPFPRQHRDFADEPRRGVHPGDDLGAGQALGDGEAPRDRRAGDQRFHHAARRDQRLEGILAGLERTLPAFEPDAGGEEHRVADDARFGQPVGDGPGAEPLRQDDRALVAQRPRPVERAPDVEPAGGQQDERQAGDARHAEQRPPDDAPHAALREPPDDHRGVGAPEPEGIGQRPLDLALPGLVRNEIQIAAR